MRDLLDEPAETWERERRADGRERLGRRAPRAIRDSDGEWPTGRWTASTWTLLLLVAFGIPEGHPAGARADRGSPRTGSCRRGVDGDFAPETRGSLPSRLLARARRPLPPGGSTASAAREAVLSAQCDDGGWNCRSATTRTRVHSSFHTTFNVLENLRIAARAGIAPAPRSAAAEAGRSSSCSAHRLYRSDHTGEVISERFTELTYPWHWHYTVPARPRLREADPRDLRSSGSPTHRPAARAAQAERALAAAEAHPRHASRRDGEARHRQPLEHPTSASRAAAAKQPLPKLRPPRRRRKPSSSVQTRPTPQPRRSSARRSS